MKRGTVGLLVGLALVFAVGAAGAVVALFH